MGANVIHPMKITRICGCCGAVVPISAPDNLCLRCLLDTAADLNKAKMPGADAQAGLSVNSTINSVQQKATLPVFGDYELLAELGRGGQGVVYRARHRSLSRLVALKTIPPDHLAGAHARERFRLEASTVSRLDHPNIVAIYEVGEADGFCFFSMKLVEGGTLAQRIAHGKLPVTNREAAALLTKIASAVHHAHQRGVLHRDLKPSNILLDHEGEPHVSDFGLARLIDEESSLTLSQSLLGTPAYLPPEVALGGGRQATVAADIYGLGAILYQLLTGQPPFAHASIAETLRAVQEEEPVTPWLARRRQWQEEQKNPKSESRSPKGIQNPKPEAASGAPGKAGSALGFRPSDLDIVCLKCLEKEPGQRYGTAHELADDLARFLRQEPILARPVSRTERAWRWCRRKPALSSFVAATALLLLAILIGSPMAAYRINRALQAEQVQLRRAEVEELKARHLAYASDMNLAHRAIHEEDLFRARQLLDRHRPAQVQTTDIRLPTPDLRGWEWRYLWRQCQGEERFILGQHTAGATAVGLLADGKTVFSAGRDKMVRLWELESRRPLGVLPHAEEVIGATASPDGRWLATATMKEGVGQPVLLWDLATQKVAATLATNFWLRPGSITFSPDNRWLAFATQFGGIRLWDVNAVSEVTHLPASNKLNFFLGLAFSPDSRTLAYNENEYGAILLWDIARRAEVARLNGHQSAVLALAFSPDGQVLASGSQDRTARLWDLSDRRERVQFTNRNGGFTKLAFSADGRTLALSGAGSAGRVIRLIEVETGKQKAELRGHLKDISGLAFTPHGQSLLSASGDGTLRVWDVGSPAKDKAAQAFNRNSTIVDWSSYGPALCLSPDGRHLLILYTNQTFGVWDTLRLAEGERHPLPFIETTFAALASGGRLAAFGNRRGEVMLWKAATERAQFFAQSGTNKVHRLVFSPDGRQLAVADDTKTLSEMAGSNDDQRRTIRVWDVGAQKQTHLFSPDGEFPVSLAFSTDAKALMAGFWRGPVKLWPLDRPGEVTTLLGHSTGVRGLALLPGGQTLISAGPDLRFWDVPTRHETQILNPGAGGFFSIALSADGHRLAVGAGDGLITIWDVVSRQELATLDGHEESVVQLAFTPDGDQLISVSKNRVRVWRAASPSLAVEFQKRSLP